MISLDCTNSEGVWKSDYEIKIDKLGYVIKNGKKTKDIWDGKIILLPQKVREVYSRDKGIDSEARSEA